MANNHSQIKLIDEFIYLLNEKENLYLNEDCDKFSCKACSYLDMLNWMEKILRDKKQELIDGNN